MSFHVVSDRPLLVAVGPLAALALHPPHSDLELCDAIAVDDEDSLGALSESGMLRRPLTVCMFDARDEAQWPTAEAVVTAATKYASLPVWFVCADPHKRHEERRGFLLRFADGLDCCAIDPGAQPPLEGALAPIAALWRTGLVGIDHRDLARIRGGTVGRHLRSLPRVPDPSACAALAVLGCDETSSLASINDSVGDLAAALPHAEIVVSAPTGLAAPLRLLVFSRA